MITRIHVYHSHSVRGSMFITCSHSVRGSMFSQSNQTRDLLPRDVHTYRPGYINHRMHAGADPGLFAGGGGGGNDGRVERPRRRGV